MKRQNLILFAAFLLFGSGLSAQENPKENIKVKIIKKTIDENGVETVEKIESNSLEVLKDVEIEDADVLIQKELSDKAALGVSIEMAENGIKILSVDGAAKTAGLLEGDIITHIDDKKINSVEELQQVIGDKKVGDIVAVSYVRNEKSEKVNAKLQQKKIERLIVERHHKRRNHHKRAQDPCTKLEKMRNEPFIGVYISSRSGTSEITDIVENTGASNSKLKKGDLITSINGADASNFDKLKDVLKSYKPGQTVKINFDRDGKTLKTRVRLSSMADRDPEYTKRLEAHCGDKEVIKEEKSLKPNEINSNIRMELFPNPATESITLNFEGVSDEPATISLSNIEGKELIQLKIAGSGEGFSEQIDISKLPKGMYLLTVKQGKEVISRQFNKI